MRIGLIIYGSLDTVTGGYIYDQQLVKYLTAKGCQVRVFSQPFNQVLGGLKNNFSKKTLSEIITFDPDILLEDEMNFASLFLMNKMIKKIKSIRIICLVHLLNAYNQNFLQKKFEQTYLKSVDGFIFNSFTTQQMVSDVIGQAALQLVVHPGKDRIKVDVDKPFILKKCVSKETNILFLGNLVYNKGLHILLQALAKIELINWRLSIAGNYTSDMTYSSKIIKMIYDLGLERNVSLLGLINSEEIAKQFLSNHILAIPSYFESYGMSYSEATGAGLPVIASNVGGAIEIIDDSINGFLVRPGDVNMVKSFLAKLINDRDLLAKMSLSALDRYQKLPSWEESMEKIYCFLQSLG